jgi:hypothetical protein
MRAEAGKQKMPESLRQRFVDKLNAFERSVIAGSKDPTESPTLMPNQRPTAPPSPSGPPTREPTSFPTDPISHLVEGGTTFPPKLSTWSPAYQPSTFPPHIVPTWSPVVRKPFQGSPEQRRVHHLRKVVREIHTALSAVPRSDPRHDQIIQSLRAKLLEAQVRLQTSALYFES